MGFSVATLANYVDQSSQDLIARSHFEGRSAAYFSIQTGIKTSAAIQLLSVSATPQADTACGFNASGSTAFTQRNITVGAIKYQDTLCLKDLRAKWTQTLLRQGSNAENEEVTFESQIADLLIAMIKEHNEVADWQGDTTSADAFKNKYDGLMKIIDDAGNAVMGNTEGITAATGITTGSSGNADTIVYKMCDARPAKTKSNTNQKLFCGTDFFDGFVDTLIAKDSYHIDATSYANYTMTIPGRNVELVGVHGLDATNRLFLGKQENFVLGTDLENEEEEFKLWYSQDDDNVKYSIKFKRGVNVAYPAEIVQFELD